jgi:hypothetical protein
MGRRYLIYTEILNLQNLIDRFAKIEEKITLYFIRKFISFYFIRKIRFYRLRFYSFYFCVKLSKLPLIHISTELLIHLIRGHNSVTDNI